MEVSSAIAYESIPIPSHKNKEALQAFQAVLTDLFERYPTPYASAFRLADYRARALGGDDPRDMCFWAVDTGAPNEEILSAYTLLFL
jgi:hypothetical protein